MKTNGSRATKWINMIKDMIAAVYHNLHQSFIFIFSLEKCNREESCTHWTFSTFRTKIKHGIIRQSYCNLYKYCNLKKTEDSTGHQRNINSTSGPKGCPYTGEINNHCFFLNFRNFKKIARRNGHIIITLLNVTNSTKNIQNG